MKKKKNLIFCSLATHTLQRKNHLRPFVIDKFRIRVADCEFYNHVKKMMTNHYSYCAIRKFHNLPYDDS